MRNTFERMALFVAGFGVIASAMLSFTPPISADDKITAFHHAGLHNSKLEDALRGCVLIAELNCTACHASESSLAAASKTSPRLSDVGGRIDPYYIERFIQSPHRVKPGTPMPAVMEHLSPQERRRTAQAITHFLVASSKTRNFAPEAVDTVAAERGEELFHTIGCAACHSPRDEQGQELMADASTPLGRLEDKYHQRSLAAFLRTPHRARPSGRMPDLKLNDREARQLAHYLLRETEVPGHLRATTFRGRVWEGLEENVSKESSAHVKDFDLTSLPQIHGNSAIVYEGFLNVSAAGKYKFFLTANGGQLLIDDAEVLQMDASSRRGVKSAAGEAELAPGWRKLKLTYIHAGREPAMKFEMQGPDGKQAPIPTERLSISKDPIEAYQPFEVDESLIDEGRRSFAKLGCAQCHNDVKVPQPDPMPALAKLDVSQGCLSDKGAADAAWPRFHLTGQQQAHIRAALPKVDAEELTQRQIINQQLVTFNCIACHSRDELGGVTPERNEHFTGNKQELGNQGRVPPTLSNVGAKLQTSWIKEVMLRGQTQRDYLATRMPLFGEANVGELTERFEKVDAIDEVTFEKIDDVPRYKQAGHQLVGSGGFSCIACHDFNGQKASGPGAMDIIHSTERLKKDWFYHYLLNPLRFQPDTIMPAAWPGGHVFKKDILDGDAKKQIESIWVYLEDGTRAKNPLGLSRKSPELRVTDVAVICRGRGTAGYRGIGVGYPNRVNLAFDSEEMNLRLLWKGEFANADHGRFSPRGGDRISFPPGIPFHRFASSDDDWPYKGKTDYQFPQDHGYQFRGYYLDLKQRPTFMYRYGDIRVEEFFEDLLDDDKNAYFRRTFTFNAPQASDEFAFRAASGESVKQIERDDASPASYMVDRMKVTIHRPNAGQIRDGDPQELLVPLKLPAGKTTLVLEYQW